MISVHCNSDPQPSLPFLPKIHCQTLKPPRPPFFSSRVDRWMGWPRSLWNLSWKFRPLGRKDERDMACGVVIWLCYRFAKEDHHESDLCRQHVFASWWSATPGLEVWKKCTGLRERRPWILSQDSKTLPCFNAVGKFTRFNLCQEHGENPDRQWTKIGCFCSDHWRCCKARSFQRFEDGTFVRAVEWSWTSSKKPFT